MSDAGLEQFPISMGVDGLISQFEIVPNSQMKEYVGAILDQDAQAFGRNITHRELIVGIHSFVLQLDTVEAVDRFRLSVLSSCRD